MKTAFLFPGQGAQYPGMGKDLWEGNPAVKDLIRLGSDVTGMDLEKLIFEGSEEELKETDKQQVAITAVSLCAGVILRQGGVRPDAAAGFSLGEFAALCEAGVLTVEDTFRTVKARGEIFAEVSRALTSQTGGPGMAAVVGLGYDAVAKVLDGIDGVFIANYNSPTQIAISGTADGLTAAEEPLKEAGARRVIRLKVSGPFHSPLLDDARRQFAQFLTGVSFADPKIAVYANVTGAMTATGAAARELCVRQVVSTVRWVDEEKNLIDAGIKRFIEVGPGTVLAGLLKALGGEAVCLPAGTLEQIRQITGE